MPEAQQVSQAFPFEGWSLESISREDIIRALDDAPKIYSKAYTQIARISSSLVVKYGSGVHLWEARTMTYVAKMPRVRLPKVFDAWETKAASLQEESTTTYIVMEYVQGDLVSDVWPGLSSERRLSIHQQVYEMIRELQRTRLAVPGPIGGGVSNGTYFTDYGAGPFLSREELEEWFNERLLVCQEFGLVKATQPSFTGQFQELVICHFDLHTQNMILDGQGNVWLIDWAYSGAYPPYFEKAALSRNVDPAFAQGLLRLMDDGQFKEEIQQLEDIGFALSTGAFCKPSGKLINPTPGLMEMYIRSKVYIYHGKGTMITSRASSDTAHCLFSGHSFSHYTTEPTLDNGNVNLQMAAKE
ncbi:hypothetical protein V500_00690 [Pseudogymnoascus sp. VKM F-4518 (FW-2643)]|nr:hypothetical protein V500_00690 [Pseudogymnoascus sp. VKM F-4518 (FW-2643)]